MDPRLFELAGEPFPVAEQVGSFLTMGLFSVSENGVLAYRSGFGASTQPMWFDRSGKLLSTLDAPGISGNVSLSPDGKRLAIDRREMTNSRQNIWLIDADHGLASRFTFGDQQENTAIWSPDGSKVYYVKSGTFDIYQKDSSGAGTEELLWKTGARSTRLGNWSTDGRHLVFSTIGNRLDIWVYSAADRNATPFLQTPFGEAQPQFSPDGRWIAYASDESGEYQIYVQSFPPGAGKYQVSRNGGTSPRWRRDGKELYYLVADSKLMAVRVKTGPKPEFSPPEALFTTRLTPQVNILRYDAAPDGRRFLLNTAGGDSTAESPITVVLSWQTAVKGP